MCTEILHRYEWSYECSPFFHVQTIQCILYLYTKLTKLLHISIQAMCRTSHTVTTLSYIYVLDSYTGPSTPVRMYRELSHRM